MAEHNQLGQWGEELAVKYLRRKGFYPVARNWHYGKRDIDIVATDEEGTIMLFVEVKTRRNNVFGEPEEAVDEEKKRNLTIAANAYIKSHYVRCETRFDIVAIVGTCEADAVVKHIPDAFPPYYFK